MYAQGLAWACRRRPPCSLIAAGRALLQSPLPCAKRTPTVFSGGCSTVLSTASHILQAQQVTYFKRKPRRTEGIGDAVRLCATALPSQNPDWKPGADMPTKTTHTYVDKSKSNPHWDQSKI